MKAVLIALSMILAGCATVPYKTAFQRCQENDAFKAYGTMEQCQKEVLLRDQQIIQQQRNNMILQQQIYNAGQSGWSQGAGY